MSIEAAFSGVVMSETIELKTSQAGKKWAAFNIGVGEGDGRQYLRISLFGGLAERAAAEITKGTKIYVEAHSLRISEWTDREGRQRHGLQAVGTRIEKCGVSSIGRNKPPRSKRNGTEQETGPAPSSPSAGGRDGDEARRDYARPLAGDGRGDDQIPF